MIRNRSTEMLQSDIKNIMVDFHSIKKESIDIVDIYNKSDIQATISSKAGGDAVTVSSKLTKDEFVNSITLCQELKDFFENAAVTQTDYLTTIKNTIYGNDLAVAVLSEAVEQIGTRLVNICALSSSSYIKLKEILEDYNTSKIATIMSSLSLPDVLFGAEMTKDDLNSAVTLIQQFQNLLGNSAVTTGDYAATICKWLVY